jgi:hypothetical protein
LEVELAFEGLVDRFDGVAQRCEQVQAGGLGFAFAGWAQHVQPGGCQLRFELFAEVGLISDQGLTRCVPHECGVGVQDGEQGFAFVGFRVGQCEPDREATEGADKV